MSFFELAEARRSIRKFKDEPISKEAINSILEAARLSPTWKNQQCCRIVVIEDREIIQKLGEAVNFNPGKGAYAKAPCFMVLCADPKKSGKNDGKDYYLVDAGIIGQQILLAAKELGLGSVFVGWFPEVPVKELLEIPEEYKVVGIFPIGVPDIDPEAKPRLNVSEFASLNKFGAPYNE